MFNIIERLFLGTAWFRSRSPILVMIFQIFWFGFTVWLRIALRLRWSISSTAFVLDIPSTFALKVNGRVTKCPVEPILLHVEILATIRIVLDNDHRISFLCRFR